MTDRGPEEETRFPSRREFVGLGIGAFVAAVAPPLLGGRRRLVRRTVPAMGTLVEVAVATSEPDRAQRAIEAALDEVRRVDRTMTRFEPDSDVGRANAAEPGRSVRVEPSTARVLEASLRWARGSDGRFDPCLGGATEAWSVDRRSRPMEPERVRRWAAERLWRALELERGSGGTARVRLHRPEASLDLGGIAKGYGVDRAAETLRRHGITDGLVSAGGDLQALGVSEDGDPWEVGVRDPANPSRFVDVLRVSDRAVATSGDYENGFDHGGRRYHHLLNPGTAEPRRSPVHSLTVTAPSCMTADAAATAAFGASREEARRLLRRVAPEADIAHTA